MARWMDLWALGAWPPVRIVCRLGFFRGLYLCSGTLHAPRILYSTQKALMTHRNAYRPPRSPTRPSFFYPPPTDITHSEGTWVPASGLTASAAHPLGVSCLLVNCQRSPPNPSRSGLGLGLGLAQRVRFKGVSFYPLCGHKLLSITATYGFWSTSGHLKFRL